MLENTILSIGSTNYFYFDIRGFFFIPRTRYFTNEVLAHFGNAPFKSFEKKQEKLKRNLEIGYKEYKLANADVDGMLLQIIRKLIDNKTSYPSC